MSYLIQFTPDAAEQLRALPAADRVTIIEHCQRILSVNPTLVSKARVKKLRGSAFPPYRLRVQTFRVFYDVDEESLVVTIYGVVSKTQAAIWLAEFQEEWEDENSDTE